MKRANPAARYCCDPVIGDVGHGIYVREGIPEFMRSRALGMADVATPNQFELLGELLSGLDTGIMEGLRQPRSTGFMLIGGWRTCWSRSVQTR